MSSAASTQAPPSDLHRASTPRAPSVRPRALSLRRTSGALTRSQAFSCAPLVAALAVDLADFATAGPLGLVAGLFVGAILTGAVSFSAGARPRRAVGLALLGALYCAVPLTEAIPFATLLTLLHTTLSRRPADDATDETSTE